MKHYLHRAGLFRPLLLMLMLLVGSGGARVWAEESTLSFTAQCKGSGTADDGVTWTVTSDGSESNFDGTKGIHYGTSKANVQYVSLSTSGISGTISKVVVNASTASGVTATVGVSIGGTVFGGAPKSLSTTATNYTFEGSASGDILVTVTKPSQSTGALYVKSVTVTYGNASSGLAASNLALTNAPVALTFDLYNNSSAQTVSFTTSSTGAVTVSGGTGYVTTSLSGNTITVTPTAVTPSAQTITVSQAADDTYAAGTATFTVSVDDSTPFYGGDFTFDATSDKDTNGEGTITKNPVTMTCSNCNLKDGVAYRMYSGSTLTFTTGKGTITNIRFKAASGYYTNQLVLQGSNGMYDNATTNQTEQSWVGSATSVSFKPSAQVRLTEIVVTVETESSAQRTPTIVTINADGITNTNRFTGTAAGSLSATVSAQTGVVENAAVTWSGNNNDVATIAADGTVTLVAAGSVAFTATYAGNDTYRGSSATYSMTVTNAAPDAPGTQNNPYTVAQARAAIVAGSGTTGVYATGIVSKIVTAYNAQSGTISYNISADGTTSGDQLLAYSGRAQGGYTFTSADDIQVGDVVVVRGDLTKYNSTYEFGAGNQLVSLTRKPEPELSFNAETATAVLGQPFTGPTLVNPNNLTVTWNSMNTAVATVDDTTGEVTLHAAGGTYIRAVFAGNDQYKPKTVSYELTVEDHTPSIVFDGQQNPLSETFTAGDTNIHYEVSYLSDEVTLVLCDAEGNPATYDWFSATLSGDDSYVAASWQANTDTQNSRTAYFYLQSGNTRSAIFAFTQAVYVVDYATLPFSWDDTTTPNGITKSGVGTYSASPYLKFDGSGDYVILKLGENEVPGTLTYDIMGNSFSGGTFTVQTSQLGVTFTDVKTHTELSGTKTTESIELDGNIRYIKWIYTNKVNGNVALGNIQVGRYVPRTVIDLRTYNPTINVSQGAFRTLLSFTTNSGAPLQLTIDEENTTLGSNDVSVKPNGDAYGEYYVELSDDFYNNVRESGVIVLKANAAAYGEYEAANEVTITVPVTGETFSAEDVNLAYDATSGQIAYSIENPLLYATLSAECDAEWISNIQVANPSAASGTITFTTTPNEGTEPRTATIILKHQYSSIQKEVNVTVTQAGLEIDYETLPFSWEGGGKQALQALNGVTANGLGSDYAADNHAPYLIKLDNTDDYIQVKTDAQPDKVTIGVKMIGGGNTSTITVQESADGETFTDVEALTISGAQDDKLSLETTNAFAADTRYVRLLFTKGSNVGVGPITITKVTPKGSADNPYTVAEARDMMDITGTEQVLAAVQGYVCEVGTFNEGTHELAYYIADAVDSNERIHIVGGKYLNGADFTEDNILHVGDFVVVQGYYSKYEGAYDCRRDNTLLSVVGPKGSANNPYTVAEARDMMDITGTEQVLATVQGYVCKVNPVNQNTQGQTYFIADAVGSDARIQIVDGFFFNGAHFTEANALHVGDFVVVQGYYSKYNGAYDCRRESSILRWTKHDPQEIAITIARQDGFRPTAEAGVTLGTLTATAQYTATGDEAAVTGISWTSADTDVAAVDANGVVTAIGPGTTTITAAFSGDDDYLEALATHELTLKYYPQIAATPARTTYGTPYTVSQSTSDTDAEVVSDGEITIEVAEPRVLSAEGEVLTPQAVGTTTITLTTAETANYWAGEPVTRDFVVLEPSMPATDTPTSAITTVFTDKNLSNEQGQAWSASTEANSFETASPARGVQFGSAIGEFTLTLPNDKTVTKVSMVVSTNGTASANTIAVAVGGTAFEAPYQMPKENNFTFEFEGRGTGDIVISVNDANKSVYFKSITVTCETDCEMAKLNANGYGTYSSLYPLDFTDSEENGYSAWAVTELEEVEDVITLRFAQVNYPVGAGTGLLLKGRANTTIELPIAARTGTGTALSQNLLDAVVVPRFVAADQFYMLKGQTFIRTTEGVVPAHKAVLNAMHLEPFLSSGNVKAFNFVFHDTATGVETVEKLTPEQAARIFDLSGRRLNKATKGINIVNGKKVLVK